MRWGQTHGSDPMAMLLPHARASDSCDAMNYWVYIVACADGTLYTGIAIDVARRLAEHNGEKPKGARYTSARRPVTLLYCAAFPTRSDAQKEEARIKKLSRADKQKLIDAQPPQTGRMPEVQAT